ncbi:MAG: coiled-coil protein [Candidatus Thorarchaeota archaeon]
MTEAAEAPLEDLDYLRAKLRELKSQAREELEQLRRDRDKMREYKAIRDEHNKEVRALIESVKAEREARDKINKEIAEAKARRSAIHAQLKSIYDEIRELRSSLVGSPSTDQRRMMRRVEELEWKQQTALLTSEEERAIVEEIARIEAKLVKIGQEKEKQDRISELRRLARHLKEEASEVHKRVLELSEQSQIHHQEVVRIRPQLEQYKKSADTAHQNFVEWLKRVKEGEARLKEIRSKIEEIEGKIRKHMADRPGRPDRRAQREQERERIEEVVEKLQSGKRLTFDEFILAQRVISSEARKARKREAEESKAAAKAEKSEDSTSTTEEPEKTLEEAPEEATEASESTSEEESSD